ncbi:MAG: hypothetical protein HQL69_06510 [Magnetococcales bacterium]|nr:hypothetical protein [Magnetococcales bacterium]
MTKTHKEIIDLLDVIDSEHTVILMWAKEIVDDIAQQKTPQYISDKAFSFKDFLLEHILKEDAELYPFLPRSAEVQAEMKKLHNIYADLEEFFMSTPDKIVAKFEDVAPKIISRIEYEQVMLKELVKEQ